MCLPSIFLLISLFIAVLVPQTLYAYDGEGTIGVSATAPSQPNNFSTAIASSVSGIHQNSEITYTVTYGSNIESQIDIVLNVSWTKGTVEGASTPSVTIVNYVDGSASQAYGSSPAVVDTTNRTIRWTINNFPGNLKNQTVSFKLKATDSYTGSNRVDFSVSSFIMAGTHSSTVSTLAQSYLYNSSLPAPSSPQTVSTTPAPVVVSPSVPPSLPISPPDRMIVIENVQMYSISKSDATIEIDTNEKTQVVVRYGTAIKNLNQSMTSLELSEKHLVKLTNLDNRVNYFFIVEARMLGQQSITSTIYTFKTAEESVIPEVIDNSVVVSSQNVILLSPGDRNTEWIVVIPQNALFEFRFSLQKQISIKTIEILVRNKDVLGISTVKATELVSNKNTEVAEVEPGNYIGRLRAADRLGTYNILAKIEDNKGNLTELILFQIKVVPYFKVLDSDNDRPIELAKVLLSRYNPATRIYEVISSSAYAFVNPASTDPKGKIDIVLPIGKYKAKVTALGYSEKEIEFIISPDAQGYPTVYLKEAPFSLFTTTKSSGLALEYLFSVTKNYFQNLSESFIYFKAVSFIVTTVMVGLAFLAFLFRTGISPLILPLYLLHHLHIVQAIKGHIMYITGIVYDKDTGKIVPGVKVLVLDKYGGIVKEQITNFTGSFFFKRNEEGTYRVGLVKSGYEPVSFTGFDDDDTHEGVIKFLMSPSSSHTIQVNRDILSIVTSFLGMMVESFLLFSLFTEIIFVFSFGFLTAIPFILFTLITLYLWLHFLRRGRNLRIEA